MAGGSRASGGPRIGIVFQGDLEDPTAWSGVPAGLAAGFAAAGAEAIGIDARPRGSGRLVDALRMTWAQASANGLLAAASGTKAGWSARRADLDGIVTIGSGYMLRSPTPSVTYEDMTVAQAMRSSDPVYDQLRPSAKQRWQARQAEIYRRSRACCAVSGWVAESLLDDYGVAPERIHVVGLGRNTNVAEVVDKDWSVPRFLFVGFDWARKRGPEVVEAFAELRKRCPQATLDLVGSHPPIEADGVTGHGALRRDSAAAQRTLAELIGNATCFLMPSRYEPFGIAYVDAGAAGVPSIGTTVGGAPDAVGPGGLVIDPNDDAALLAAMLELADPARAQQLGGLASSHAELFTWRAVSERLLRALRAPGLDLDRLSPYLDPPK
jgi:glycogen synthase